MSPLSLLYAAGTAILTRSFTQTLAALLLVNPRVALIGQESADFGTNARVLRGGVTVIGTRKERIARLPGFVCLDGPRMLTDGFELSNALPLTEEIDSSELLALAAGIAAAAGSPWGDAFRAGGNISATNGAFDGKVATAHVEGVQYSLAPVEDWSSMPEASGQRQHGNYVLLLRSEREPRPLGIFALRPRLAPGVSDLVQICQRYGVELGELPSGDQTATQALAKRTGVPLLDHDNAVEVIRARQQKGAVVFFVSDNAGAAAGFQACDLAIGVSDDHTRLPARVDLLAPDLTAVAAIIEATARREAAVRDSVGLSVVSNIIGAVWGFRGIASLETASRTMYIAALAAIADGWLRLRGGERPGATLRRLVDPRPERWGRRSLESVLRTLHTSAEGLTSAQAAE